MFSGPMVNLAHVAFGQGLFKLAVRNRLHFWRKKVLLQIDKQKEGNQEIPDAEMSLRGQGILLFLGSGDRRRNVTYLLNLPLALWFH